MHVKYFKNGDIQTALDRLRVHLNVILLKKVTTNTGPGACKGDNRKEYYIHTVHRPPTRQTCVIQVLTWTLKWT